jgi:hypothetical protein
MVCHILEFYSKNFNHYYMSVVCREPNMFSALAPCDSKAIQCHNVFTNFSHLQEWKF